MTRYVEKFVLCFTSCRSWKCFKQQKWPLRSLRALAMVPFDRPHTLSYSTSIATIAPLRRYHHYFPKFREITWLWTDPFGKSNIVIYLPAHVLCCINQHTKLKCLASPITKIWVEENVKKGHVTLTTPLSRVLCHRRLGFDTVYLHIEFVDTIGYHWSVKIYSGSRPWAHPF